MKNKKHIVIFSHGFGTKKDDRGLLSGDFGISEALEKKGVETVLFDYNKIDDKNNTITVTPLREQIKILEGVIAKVVAKNPGCVIDIIAHSQGCLVPAKLLPSSIRKTILLSPSLNVDNQRMINLFKDHPDTRIDLNGISTLGRKDGTMTIVSSLYWTDRESAEPIPMYNKLSKITEITMILAKQDDILRNLRADNLSKEIRVISLDGDHSFNGKDRKHLLEVIEEIILN